MNMATACGMAGGATGALGAANAEAAAKNTNSAVMKRRMAGIVEGEAMPTSWEIDPNHTTVEFAVKHMMFTTVRGRFKDVKGTILADESDPSNSSVNVEIAAASIDTGVGDRDAHLKSADFLDVEHHPTITFRSKRVEGASGREGARFEGAGDVAIGGATLEVTLDCTCEGMGPAPWGATPAAARATAEID